MQSRPLGSSHFPKSCMPAHMSCLLGAQELLVLHSIPTRCICWLSFTFHTSILQSVRSCLISDN